MSNQNEEVNQFMEQLEHPLKNEINTIRAFILNSNNEIAENIKWNAPNFSYKGEDRITFKLFPYTSIQLIFHRGSKVKDTKDFSFTDSSGLLKWITDDRAMLTLAELSDVETKKKIIIQVVQEWLDATTE